jgi:hypothetical protein
MVDVVISDEQVRDIVAAIHSLKGGGIRWEQVVPVFVSALLAMLVGIGLEYFKSYREKKRGAAERNKRELQQINAAVVGIAYNIEALLHVTGQHLIPHFEQSGIAYKELQEASGDREKMSIFAATLHKFSALMTKSAHDALHRNRLFGEAPISD